MKDIKRVFLIVLDSVGAGEAPDAALFGDVGAHTLRSAWQSGCLHIPTLCSMGLGNIEGLDFLGKAMAPTASFARMKEASIGKDTTVGHWEICGHISSFPLPTFPQGFPEEILDKVRAISGRELLCNKAYSGTQLLIDYGDEALEKKALIIYTSADSVLQLAAHTDVLPLQELYRICEELRAELVGRTDGVGRIIARPFEGSSGAYKRTADRRDYSLNPPSMLLPEALKAGGLDSIAIGKISDIFANVGFTKAVRTHSNKEGMELTEKYISKDFRGLCFVNLVDFDMLWGHRRDAKAYAEGLNEFDIWLGRVLPMLREDDLLMITADHGCDPAFTATTDHTREYTPMLCYGRRILPTDYKTRESFADIGATVAHIFGGRYMGKGSPIELNFKE